MDPSENRGAVRSRTMIAVIEETIHLLGQFLGLEQLKEFGVKRASVKMLPPQAVEIAHESNYHNRSTTVSQVIIRLTQ